MYYGNRKIFTITDAEEGKKLVSFEDNTSVVITDLMAGVAITEEPVDDTKLREIRCFPAVKDILEILLKWDIHIGELDFVLTRTTMSVEQSVEQASLVLWGISQSGYQNMSDVDKVLKGKVDPNKVHMDEETTVAPAVEEAVAPEAPVEAPVEETPAEAPVVEAPAEEAPAEATPTEEAPAA